MKEEIFKVVVGGCYRRKLNGDIFQLIRISNDDPDVGIFRAIRTGSDYYKEYWEEGEKIYKWRIKNQHGNALEYDENASYQQNLKEIIG